MVEHLPLAQGVILGSQYRVPHQPPLGEPASPSAYVSASASLCISHEKINKIFKSQKERTNPVRRDEEHYFIIKKTIKIKQLNIYAANMGVPKYRNQLTTNVQELTDNNTVTGDFHTHLWQWTDHLCIKSKGNNSLDTLDHRDSTDIV